MPIYEYQCQACGHDIEVIQKMSDPPLEECSSCGELTLKKKVSAAAFRLKGGGWYETDFKTGDKKKNIAGDKSSGDTSAGDGKSSESAKDNNGGKSSKGSGGSDSGGSSSSSKSSAAAS